MKIGYHNKKPPPEAPPHPEDVAAEADGEAYADAHSGEFFRTHQHEFRGLVAVYSDAKASELLDELRERFWARRWVPDGLTRARAQGKSKERGQ